MRYYLNKALKSKKNTNGEDCHPVYFRFSVNSQTFKIKSKIINRPWSDSEFEQYMTSENIFLAKDQQIISQSIHLSINNGFLNIQTFKIDYSKNTTSIYYWLRDYIGGSSNRVMDEFMHGRNTESIIENVMVEYENRFKIDRYATLSYLYSFHKHYKGENSFRKHLLTYDWFNEDLRQEFSNYLRGRVAHQHSQIIEFIDAIIKII